MGLYASADLVYGIVVNAYLDDDCTPHPLWDEDEGDWRDLEPNDHIELHYFGHYENSDDPKVIVRMKATREFSGDCWDPTEVPERAMDGFKLSAFACNDESQRQGYDLDFVKNAKWWLVASYG